MDINSSIWILTLSTIFEVIILVGVLIISINFRVWAKTRDTYYKEKMEDFEERLHRLEENYAKDFLEMLKQNKDTLQKIQQSLKK